MNATYASIHATLLVAWSGTLAFQSVWFALLARLRREDGAFGLFAAFSLAIALALLWTARGLATDSVWEQASLASVQFAYFGIAAALFEPLVDALAPRSDGRRRRRVLGPIAVPFSVLAASGLVVSVDPARVDAPMMTTVGSVASVALCLGSIAPLVSLIRAAGTHRELRVVGVAVGSSAIGALTMAGIVPAGSPAVQFAPHASGVVTLAIAAALMRRMASTEDELEVRSVELERSLEALRAAESALYEARSRAALGELAAVVAHEVRNPLAVLRNAAASLRKPALSSVDAGTLVEIVVEETKRLELLARSLAEFAEPSPAKLGPVELGALLRDAISAVRRAHDGARGVTFVVRGEVGTVLADAELLRQAVVNVVDNAVRAMPTGGCILVSVERDGDRARVEVADDGEGMSSDVLRRARDPFYTTRATGTGLGLALVERVARSHGGELALESSRPGGTRVSWTVPLASPMRVRSPS